MGKVSEYVQNAMNCLYINQEYEQGYHYAQQAFMINRNSPEIKYLYAVALYFNDKCEDALKYFFELGNTDIHPDGTCIYIAHCLSKTRKNLLLALKYINKTKQYHYDEETKINILMIKAEIQYRMGNYNAALKNFLKAYEMGDDDKSLCYISQIYFDKNNPMLAMKYLRKLLHFNEINKDEFWQRFETLTFKELKESLIILLNRFELKKNKKKLDPVLEDNIFKKLNR